MTILIVSFGKYDDDLKRWRISLKNEGYSLGSTIISMIKADLAGIKASVPEVPLCTSELPKSMTINVTIRNHEAEEHLASLPPLQKSRYIKDLIRKSLSEMSVATNEKPKMSSTTHISKKKETEQSKKKPKNKEVNETPVSRKITHSSSLIISDEEEPQIESEFDFSKLLGLAGEV